MHLRRPAAARLLLCLLPLSLLACSTESASSETVASANEALSDECSKVNPDAYTVPIDGWDEYDLRDIRHHGCSAPFLYFTGFESGIISGTMSVCRDDRTAHAFVAERTGNNPGAWAPTGFCDHALEPLPKGYRYVVWMWTIGPNCSGCKDGGGHISW